MIFWNFCSPITLLGCCIWNFSEAFGIGLGKLAPYIFGIAVGAKPKKNNRK